MTATRSTLPSYGWYVQDNWRVTPKLNLSCGLRSDMTNHWNTDIQREIKFRERVSLQLRMDVLNPFNRTQMDPPDTSPLSTNFAKITQQSWTAKRYIQIRARLSF